MPHVLVTYLTLCPCGFYELVKSHVTIIFKPCRCHLGICRPVEFKKYPCRPVNFKVRGPLTYIGHLPGWVHTAMGHKMDDMLSVVITLINIRIV